MKLLTTLLLGCLFSIGASAQTNPKVLSFKVNNTDIIASDQQRRDANNKLCALVKVQVLDEITDVEGTPAIGSIVNKGNEKWIYLPERTRFIKLLFKNNLPLTVRFRDHGVTSLKSNTVYELVVDVPVKGSAQETAAAVKTSELTMLVSPANATITIQGETVQKREYYASAEGVLQVTLPREEYHYTVSAPDYVEQTGEFYLTNRPHTETVNLHAVTSTVTITCETEQPTFYIDGQALVKSNQRANFWTGEVPHGTHLFEVMRDGYITASREVTILPGQSTTVTFAELQRDKKKRRGFSLFGVGTKKDGDEMYTPDNQPNTVLGKPTAKQLKDAAKEAKRWQKEAKKREKAERKAAKQREKDARKQRRQQNNDVLRVNDLLVEQPVSVRPIASQPVVSQPVVNYTSTGNARGADDERKLTFGVRAGVGASTIEDHSGTFSFRGGVGADVRLSNSIYLNSALLFAQKGGSYWSAQLVQLQTQLSLRPANWLQINVGP